MKISCLSIVVPCFNEESNIQKLFDKLIFSLKPYDFKYEIIFVDDGSSDTTFSQISNLSHENSFVKGISLSRNFGHQIALLAGLENGKGDIFITMDADLQHPPDVIPELISKYKEGHDIVNTRREYDESVNFFKKTTSKWFYFFINKMSEIKVEPLSADFRLMNRAAVDAFLQLKEHDRFTRGLVSWIGFKQAIVPYKAHPRYSGKSAYTFKKMLLLAVNGITSMSSKPLRLSLYLGIIFFLSGMIYAIIILLNYFKGINVEGWTSILISILIIGGIQLLILSIIGEYVARIFNETKSRPLYLIKSKTPGSQP